MVVGERRPGFYRPPASRSQAEVASYSKFFRTGPDLPAIRYDEVFKTLPLIDMMSKAASLAGGRIPSEYELFLKKQNDLTDPWWNKFNYLRDEDRVDAPSLFIESWNDFTASAALYVRTHFEKTGVNEPTRQNQFIIVSPASHCQSERMVRPNDW